MNRDLNFYYGTSSLSLSVPEERLLGVLTSRAEHLDAGQSQEEIIRLSLLEPIGSPSLSELARGKRKIVYLASDHTRPVPSRLIFPLVMEEIEKSGFIGEFIILVATGCHRPPTSEELATKFGQTADLRNIVIHNCDTSEMVLVGSLPSGGPFKVNKLALEADLLLAEGFIEPHFFAGFSGGRKSVLPGITDRAGVMYNHSSAFIAHEKSRTGILEDNPIHEDMVYAASAVNLAFIVNPVLDAEKRVVASFAGHYLKAHQAGTDYLKKLAGVKAIPADIVIATNGGYPLDQNLYQAVKGLTAAEATIKDGGVIIMVARAEDGHGGEEFFETFRQEKNLTRMMDTFLARNPAETVPDQWQSQILARILLKHRVIMVTEAPREMVENFQMLWAPDLKEALALADQILGRSDAGITAIPDGLGVIVS